MQTTGLDTNGRPLTITSLSTGDFSRAYTDPMTTSKLAEKWGLYPEGTGQDSRSGSSGRPNLYRTLPVSASSVFPAG